MIKNNIQSFFSNKNNATIFIVALFFVIWQNPSEQKMKNSALDYIIAQNSNISKIRVQKFLDEKFIVNNYLLFSTSSIDNSYTTGVGFLSYSKPRRIIYNLFIKWGKPLLEDENIKASAAFIKLKGDVKIKHYDKTIFNDGYLGENIYANDSIRIGDAPSFSAFQYLESKSIIKIRENTTFLFHQNDLRDEITLYNGIIINEINNIKNKGFRVRTSAGIASVKGTVFAVKVDSSKGVAEFIGKTGSFEVESLISGEVLTVDGLQKITANINGDFILESITSNDFPTDPTQENPINNNYSIIRDYDFEQSIDNRHKERIETAITLFNANILEYPTVTSSVIQQIKKGEKIKILPLYRDGFFIVLNDDSNAIGYIDEYDIDFESENIKDKIKEYSSNNFLDSKSLME